MSALYPSMLLLAVSLATTVHAESFTMAADGRFVSSERKLVLAREDYTATYQIGFGGEQQRVQFIGPVFPGYALPTSGTVTVHKTKPSVTDVQPVASPKGTVTKRMDLVNGSIVTEVTYAVAKTDSKENPAFRIILPLKPFAGNDAICNGLKVAMPLEKSANYTLASGTELTEFRLGTGDGQELGIRLLSPHEGVHLADCRHHPTPEQSLHLWIAIKDGTLRYQTCLLAVGEPFPRVDAKKR
ncbi:MAG: hypothetical protein H0W72_09285 [Planctomycetes bacterium]|nr:hypothetical protein [Planctomycetota bacterium]